MAFSVKKLGGMMEDLKKENKFPEKTHSLTAERGYKKSITVKESIEFLSSIELSELPIKD